MTFCIDLVSYQSVEPAVKLGPRDVEIIILGFRAFALPLEHSTASFP